MLSLLLVSCAQKTLTLSTTTSTYDSGLLDVLLPPFERSYNVKVKVVAVGSGQAIALGEKGDADVLLVHSRALEDAFVAAGHGVNPRDVMYNDFVIIGPEDDPAQIRGLTSAAQALSLVSQAKATFVSRGDESGTHLKEKAIWAAAGLTPDANWYISSGQGMGATLTMANEMMAYTLTDLGTYLTRQQEIDLAILVQGDEMLFNPYRIIAVNPEKHPHVNYELAVKFIDYMTSTETQQLIAEFGIDKYGQPLFYPNSQQWRAEE